jgi:hypothetical protein
MPRSWVRLAGVLAVAVLFAPLAIPRGVNTDFDFYWLAAALWRDGLDPYAMRPGDPAWPLPDPIFYPLPTLILVWPLTFLPVRVAALVFAAGAVAGMAWLATRDDRWRLVLLLSSPAFLHAVSYGQWSPYLVVGALVPSAAFLLAAKPTLGLACFCYRPTWRGVASMAAIGVLSLALMPDWPLRWLENLNAVRHHPAPIAMPFGWLVLLALLRWRQPEARLLVAMACVPQLLAYADQLPLVLVARTKLEGACLVLTGWLTLLIAVSQPAWNFVPATAGYYVLLGCYVPALYLVLRRSEPPHRPIQRGLLGQAGTLRAEEPDVAAG